MSDSRLPVGSQDARPDNPGTGSAIAEAREAAALSDSKEEE